MNEKNEEKDFLGEHIGSAAGAPGQLPQSAVPQLSHAGPMVSGDASRGDIEIRFDPPDERNFSAIDEVVANGADVHLERMDKGQWSLIIYAKNQKACFMINGKDVARSVVTTQVFWLDQVGSETDSGSEASGSARRSEAPK